MNLNLKRPVKITVCGDGFVSIMTGPKDRRLKAALPCHSAWNLKEALELIAKVCILRACAHGGKLGMTVEAHAPDWWPENAEPDSQANIQRLADLFQKVDTYG